MKRTPDDHYTAAQAHAANALHAHAIASDAGQTKDTQAEYRELFDRYMRLAELHRGLAETGLAFESTPDEWVAGMKPEPVETSGAKTRAVVQLREHTLLISGTRPPGGAMRYAGTCSCERDMGTDQQAPEAVTLRWVHHLQDVRRARKNAIGWGTERDTTPEVDR